MDVYAYKATRFGNYYSNPEYACGADTREEREVLLSFEIPER